LRVNRLLTLVPVFLILLLLQGVGGIWNYQADGALCPAGTILVMGAAQYDGRPSPAFQRRLDRALELFLEGCTERLVVSGGRQPGDRFSEGDAGVNYLHAAGVPAGALFSEDQATTSFENLRNSVPLIEGDLLIVTDDMHAYRSSWLARHFGLDARVATVGTRSGRLVYGLRELLVLTSYQAGILR
jgi:uncharacterized SAM-binding protein YcdF (DUF218 family)